MSAADEDGFLSRWSKRKQAALRQDEPAVVPDQKVPSPAEPDEAPSEAIAQPEPEPEIEPPSLSLIDKDFELAPWLKRNVPQAWKLAAMRLAWETDPAIRDFQNPARDYALDWNTPGGAPGYGPLSESDDVQAMLRQIMGEPEETPEPDGVATEGPEDVRLSSSDASVTPDAAPQKPAPPGPGMLAESAVRRTENAILAGDRAFADAAAQPAGEGEPTASRPRRRGGGAAPV